MRGDVYEVDQTGFYVEVHHMRGNFSKFEAMIFNPETGEDVVTELDVWDFRRRDHNNWHIGFILAAQFEEVTEHPVRFRVTRYPDLEQDILDTTYHPSVESWNIDYEKVKGHFFGNE